LCRWDRTGEVELAAILNDDTAGVADFVKKFTSKPLTLRAASPQYDPTNGLSGTDARERN
jgi:hypothetical protein